MPKSGRDAGNPSVERDVRSMERKKRVTEVLEDNFRNELEGVVVSQKEGNKPLFHAGIKINSGRGSPEFKGLAGVRQVNDLNGALRDRYSKAERELRCKLAALYRLTAMFEWDHLIYSHITARLPGEEEHYLINAYGMQYSEVTASSLVKIDKDANIIDPGSTLLPVNKAGWKLNSALHSTGRNIVYHTHSHAGTAISAMKCGLLNLCQEALIVRPVSYGTYQGFVPSVPEQDQLKADLEPDSNVMILENHGLVSVGKTIEEAFLWMAQLTKACEIQWRVLRTGRDNLTDRTSDENKAFEGDLPVELVCSPQGKEYGPGELEFESYMRKLDNNGANTGYPYKTPTLFKDQLPSYPAVQYPPIVPGMEGSPSESDSDRSRPSASQRSAWFKNPTPVEQRMTPPSSDNNSSKGKPDSKDKKLQPPKKFAPFDAVVASPRSDSRTGSDKGDFGYSGSRSTRMRDIERELEKMQAQYSSPKPDAVSAPSSDGKRSDEYDVQSLSDDTDKSLDVVVSADLEDMPTVEADTVDQVEQVPYFSRDVTVDTKMSVTVDSDVDHNVTKEVDIRVGEDGVTVAEEIVQHTVTTSIVEITEVQEEEFEVITVRPGQLTEEQKEELRRQGYVLQEEQ